MFGDASKLTLALPRARRRTVALTGLAGLGLAACGDTRQATSAAPTFAATIAPTARPIENLSLRLSWIKNTEFAGFFVAQDRGFYKDEGINLTINGSAQNLTEVQAVTGKTDQIGLSGAATLMIARSTGIPVKAIGAVFQKGPGAFVWLESSGIKGIKDFKGKKIGHQQSARHLCSPDRQTFSPGSSPTR